MPKVSVVIPTYNMADWLSGAIESVLGQTFRDWELIVVDDGSTDSTEEVIARFGPSLTYFRQENAGLAVTRNRGSKLATGEYILFLDADDLLLADGLEKAVPALDEAPQAGFAYGQVKYMDTQGADLGMLRQWPEHSRAMSGREVLLNLLDHQWILPSAILFRRGCYEETGGCNEELRLGQDQELLVRLIRRWPAVYIAEPLAWRRKHARAATAKPDFGRRKPMWAGILEEATKPPAFGMGRRRMALYVYASMARNAYDHDMASARDCIIRGLRVGWPWLLSGKGRSLIYLFVKSFLPGAVRGRVRSLMGHRASAPWP